MSLVFLDTSALIKLYLTEAGSDWLRNYLVGNEIVISELALYESATVLRRRYLDSDLTLLEARTLYATLQMDSLNFTIILLRAENQLERVVDLVFALPAALRVRAGRTIWTKLISFGGGRLSTLATGQLLVPIPKTLPPARCASLRRT